MRLSTAITKNATAVQRTLCVRSQITPPAMIAGRSMNRARSTATIKTTMINSMIIMIKSPPKLRKFIGSHFAATVDYPGFGVCASGILSYITNLPLLTNVVPSSISEALLIVPE
jgi:hypothetical protein